MSILNFIRKLVCITLILLITISCDRPALPPSATTDLEPNLTRQAEGKVALFGDLHVHTAFSFDAFGFGTRASPDDAYRYALGEAIQHPAGFDVQLRQPLDFYAVTDHATFLGMGAAMYDPSTAVSKHPLAKAYTSAKSPAERGKIFSQIARFLDPAVAGEMQDREVVRSAWQQIITSAEKFNQPGKFTTLIGYEYSSAPDNQNLHRNVIFQNEKVPNEPFSWLMSPNPEKLWDWMDQLRLQGINSLAIPHNSNGSNGQMFSLLNWAGENIDKNYAQQRSRNEPLVEITQAKGTSDTHPALSPNDEWADFEISPYRVASTTISKLNGSYVREALQNGLVIEAQTGINPYAFGIIGSSDTHNAASSLDESNFFSKIGRLDATAQQRGSVPLDEPDSEGNVYREGYLHYWGAAGLAGVWAYENTREAIYQALERRETFGTSGTRIRVRFFASYEFAGKLLDNDDLRSTLAESSVPMGGSLKARSDQDPGFFIWAMQDPFAGKLQRLQIIKGWVIEGTKQEKVYDVACSDGVTVNATTNRCPDNNAGVDLQTCTPTENLGAAELKTFWKDPDFDPAQKAFYYVRVLENPSCRWSTWDALRADVPPRPDVPTTIQERAWSSPIWVVPMVSG